jgi:NAD(P)-dependent dehydrogenase (short-subunit alcohol dehydrogenase family)
MALQKKVALVTGGRGALGSVLARRLVEEGAHVVVSFQENKEKRGGKKAMESGIVPVRADLTKQADVVALYDAIVKKFSRVDIVLNTVGGFLPAKPLVDVTLTEWNRMLDINLKSTFLSTREALRRMKGQPYGRIINISAMVGLNPTPGKAPYGVAKAGVSLLTEIVAQEQKGTGITINAIAPSTILTPANLAWATGGEEHKWVKPEEIADLIVYLCSVSASAITGTTIKAYGGV